MITDIQQLQPTVFGSFPLFFNKLVTKIRENIETRSEILKTLIQHVIKVKMQNYERNGAIAHFFWDNTVLKPIRNIMGGRIRVFISGGAPLC